MLLHVTILPLHTLVWYHQTAWDV